ncbi:MAG: glycosyltransferase family 2 protein [Bacteroidales bacterium]|nr:glycosyltransferase family 2 protein [Bacteroidales bacterium]
MKIFSIIVAYNGMQWYERCLGSLRDSGMPIETIVVDNASIDETVTYIKEHFPNVILIESKKNLGFAKANNIGIKRALDSGADYIFLLNQDAWVEKDTLSKLVQTFNENENVGIVSPIHLNGTYTGLDWGFLHCVSDDLISDLYVHKLKKFYQVNFVNAAAWLVSAESIKKVGGFDTLLFQHYGEDDNYCQRVIYHGFKILLNTQCTICHDRQERCRENENTYRQQYFSQEYKVLKVRLGNINHVEDMDKRIRMYYLYMLKSILCLNIKKLCRQKKEIQLLKQIKQSRQINKTTGAHWL